MASTHLYASASVEEQWRAVSGPWLREQAGLAWKNTKPTVILTPTRAEGFYLRSRMVDEKVPFLGLRFWTPSDARKFILQEVLSAPGSATQAELRLVARACAEKLLRRTALDNATLKSVIREPGAFLRAYDLHLGAGWDLGSEGAIYGRELARQFELTLDGFQIATQAGLHRHLRREVSSRKDRSLANLLVIGFNAAHWPLWDLLKALVFTAEYAVVGLTEPRVFAEKIDQLWVGSWEEVMQTEALSPIDNSDTDDFSTPLAALVDSYEKGSPGKVAISNLTFLVTPDLASHVRAVVLQALDYLRTESCARLGIVFAEANALALGVTEELHRQGILLDDGTGLLVPGPFEKRGWQSWLALQGEPGVPRLIAWIRACEAEGLSCGIEPTLSSRDVAKILDNALGETLVDDLSFLAGHLKGINAGKHAHAVADFLRHLIVLPEAATFAEFLARAGEALSLPGWEEYRARLQIKPSTWLLDHAEQFSRRAFLEWLKEATASQVRTRGNEGNHFYGKVHLLIYPQISGQTWSHLILTGLNEGVWPRVYESGAFGSRHELAALNQLALSLNRRGTGQGRQGMGHETVLPDRGHCLLPLERRDLGLRDLCAALESTRAAACLTSMTTQGGRSLLPSDFFCHAYLAQTGCSLDEKIFRNLANHTEAWCDRHEHLFIRETPGASDITATRTAYAARRDSTRPFGPYEFAYAQSPRQPIQLSCKQWEDAWLRPSSVWLERIVGASAWPEGTLSWPRAVGIWVHNWLAAALREWSENSRNEKELPRLVLAAADDDARTIRARAQAGNLVLYPWWNQVWSESRTRAWQLGEAMAPLLPGHSYLFEFKLPRELIIALPGSTQPSFKLNGRIDFLRFEGTEPDKSSDRIDLSGRNCWIIDFKTGSSKPLTHKNILKGTGLQALLYAMAARALGASTTSISLLAPGSVAKPQVELDASFDPILISLNKLHREGIFGLRVDTNSEYSLAARYPLAMQFIPSYILEAKWALTHGPSGDGDEI